MPNPNRPSRRTLRSDNRATLSVTWRSDQTNVSQPREERCPNNGPSTNSHSGPEITLLPSEPDPTEDQPQDPVATRVACQVPLHGNESCHRLYRGSLRSAAAAPTVVPRQELGTQRAMRFWAFLYRSSCAQHVERQVHLMQMYPANRLSTPARGRSTSRSVEQYPPKSVCTAFRRFGRNLPNRMSPVRKTPFVLSETVDGAVPVSFRVPDSMCSRPT